MQWSGFEGIGFGSSLYRFPCFQGINTNKDLLWKDFCMNLFACCSFVVFVFQFWWCLWHSNGSSSIFLDVEDVWNWNIQYCSKFPKQNWRKNSCKPFHESNWTERNVYATGLFWHLKKAKSTTQKPTFPETKFHLPTIDVSFREGNVLKIQVESQPNRLMVKRNGTCWMQNKQISVAKQWEVHYLYTSTTCNFNEHLTEKKNPHINCLACIQNNSWYIIGILNYQPTTRLDFSHTNGSNSPGFSLQLVLWPPQVRCLFSHVSRSPRRSLERSYVSSKMT